MPKVTIIVPCYNRERFIAKTLDSILCQSYGNIQVVAVDDGSTDMTRSILENYGERIEILEHPGRINKGQSASINLAIRSTQSEYIGIVDSDDVLAKTKIERQVVFLEENPDIGFVYANGHIIDEDGKLLHRAFPPGHTEDGTPERMLLECPIGCPSGYLVRRSAFERAGYFDESLRSAQDHDMAIRLAEVAKLAFLNEDLWYYRRHSDSLSYKHAKRRWQAGFVILRKACARYPYGFNLKRRRLAVLHFRMGQSQLEEKRYLAAATRFVMAAVLDPTRTFMVLTGKEPITSHH